MLQHRLRRRSNSSILRAEPSVRWTGARHGAAPLIDSEGTDEVGEAEGSHEVNTTITARLTLDQRRERSHRGDSCCGLDTKVVLVAESAHATPRKVPGPEYFEPARLGIVLRSTGSSEVNLSIHNNENMPPTVVNEHFTTKELFHLAERSRGAQNVVTCNP